MGTGNRNLELRASATAKTPGQAAHDTWCADDDWDELSADERALWEDTAWKAHAAIVAAEIKED